MFQAIVSVMAVNIQLSSPSGVLRSVCLPGILSTSSCVMPSSRSSERSQNHHSAALIGVVRQAVKMSAGRLPSCGRRSFAPQAASTIESLSSLLPPTWPDGGSLWPCRPASGSSWQRCSANWQKELRMSPAEEQSNM